MARKIFLNLSLLLVLVLFSSGCAVNRATATLEPTANLAGIKSLHVTLAPDDWCTRQLIVNKFKTMGYMVDAGVDRPSNVDAVVTYAEKWMWDLTMYMLELTVLSEIREMIFPWHLAILTILHLPGCRLKKWWMK